MNSEMAPNYSAQPTPEQQQMRQPLIELHGALVKLHKALLDSERQVYEKDVGRIQSPNHFFQLLTSDPFFSWLRPISQLIVAIDETLDAKELTHADVDAVMNPLTAMRRCIKSWAKPGATPKSSATVIRFKSPPLTTG